MKLWSSRDRVIAALAHEEPDRVPTTLWGSYYTLQDGTYFNLLDYLKLGEPVPPFRRYKSRNSNYLDDRILDVLGTDIRYAWLGFDDLAGAHPETNSDAWGIVWKRIGDYISPISAPLANAGINEIADFEWPKPEKYIRLDELRERIGYLKKLGNFAISARAVNSYGPFEQACAIRGREQFLIDLLAEPELAQLLIDKVTDVIVRLNEIYLSEVGKDIDIIEIPGDDYAGTNTLIFSLKVFNKFMKPALERIISPIKVFRPDLYVAFHSDGAIMKLLPTFIDVGIDLFHPLEPLPENDMQAIKTMYGDKLSFMGAVDIKQALPGSIKDVEAEVQKRIQLLAQGGGYILTTANHLQTDIPPQNIIAMFKFAQEYGRYKGGPNV
jgi:uroporphyrinogen decarboxylase